MAGVRSTVQINDGMSPALRSMNKALNIVLNSFEKLQSTSANSIDTNDIRDARTELANAATAVSKLEEELEQAGNEQKKFTNEVHHTESAMSGLLSKVGTLIATYATFQTLLSAVKLSDQITQTESRLNLIVDVEAGESVDELTQKIMESANRSRASYLETSKTVASFAQRAGDAFDNNNDQVIAFVETLNKMYAIAGATAEEQYSSMLQLTQALGSGVLRGEEFNAVFEAAPNIMQAVAEYMDVPIGKLRDMAAEGQITADIVKNAIFSASEEVNEDFNSMNMTWQQMWTLFQNKAIEAFDPVLRKINELANNKDVVNFINGIVSALPMVANVVLQIFELVASVASFLYENWEPIEPLIMGIITALGLYVAALLTYNAIQAISAGITAVKAAAEMMASGATFAATAAQHGFNAALLACPIFWIVAGVIALIAVIAAVCSSMDGMAGVATSAFGKITGGVNVVMAFFKNLGLFVANMALGIGNAIAALASNMMSAFSSAIHGIQGWFYGLLATVVETIAGIAAELNKLPFVSFDYEGVSNAAADYAAKAAEHSGYEAEYTDISASFAEGMSTFDSFGEGWAQDAYAAGAAWGDGISNKIAGATAGLEMAGIDTSGTAGGGGGYGGYADDYLNDIANNTGSGAGSAKDIVDALELSEEDLKYIRDIAEQEAINRFTTAEIKIDMQNNNTIGSNMDLDGMVSYLEDKLYESMEIAAEGVH